jgi:protein SCO1
MQRIRSFVIPGLIVLILVFGVQAKSATIVVGESVPDFTLIDQSGEEVSLSNFKGKGVVISFLYTKCPYPDKCPMIGKKLAGLAELSEKIGKKDQLQVLAITLDPANDKPEVLKAYARGFDERYDNWKFLTGTENDIARVAAAFGVIYWTENGVVEHNMRTAFIDPAGKLRILKSGSDWKAGQFAAEIKEYME